MTASGGSGGVGAISQWLLEERDEKVRQQLAGEPQVKEPHSDLDLLSVLMWVESIDYSRTTLEGGEMILRAIAKPRLADQLRRGGINRLYQEGANVPPPAHEGSTFLTAMAKQGTSLSAAAEEIRMLKAILAMLLAKVGSSFMVTDEAMAQWAGGDGTIVLTRNDAQRTVEIRLVPETPKPKKEPLKRKSRGRRVMVPEDLERD